MRKLLDRLHEEQKKRNIKNKEIAYELNVSAGTVSNWYKGTHVITFENYMQLVKHICTDRYKYETFIVDFITKMHKIKQVDEIKQIKLAIEWCFNNGKAHIAEKLINRYKEYDQVFELYELLLRRNKRLVSNEEFYILVDRFKKSKKIDDVDTMALSEIMTMYAHFSLYNYNMFFLKSEAYRFISQISEQYLRKSFDLRFCEIQAFAELKENNTKEAEIIALDATKETNTIEFPLNAISMYSILGELHLFTDYEKSNEYISKAFEILSYLPASGNKYREESLKATHDFINIFHGKYNSLYLNNDAEKAYYFAKIGKREAALELLNKLEKQNGKLTPHQLYYKAIACGSEEIMKQSEDGFFNYRDKFYINLPRKYGFVTLSGK